MARPATGAPKWDAKTKRWIARVTIPGSGRVPVPLVDDRGRPLVPPCLVGSPGARCTCASCQQAKRVAQIISDRTRNEGRVPDDARETANEWFARYVKRHGELGNGTSQHAGDWNRWAADTIGTKPMAAISPEDVKAIRDGLTRAHLEGKLAAKRVLNVWSMIVKAPFSRAWSDDDPKYSELRVGPHRENPAEGIKPPVSRDEADDDERERQALERDEAEALLACRAVALDDRRFYAFVMLTGITSSEAYALTIADLRLEATRPVVKVQRSLDMKTGEISATKTRDRVRDVPVHPYLLPLLRAMVKGRAAGDRLFALERVRDAEKAVARLRDALVVAGLTRPELRDGTTTLRPFDVRSFRTCFATWCARSGFDSAWIDAWLGHVGKSTAARHYVKDTGTLAAGVFPRVPEELITNWPNWVPGLSDSAALECEGRDLNPYRSYPTGT